MNRTIWIADAAITQVGSINLLIAGGTKTSVGQWPWLVAIYITKNTFELQCAGSLVTDTHVITGKFVPMNMKLSFFGIGSLLPDHELIMWNEFLLNGIIYLDRNEFLTREDLPIQ